ncbi:MAG: hypothetical protein A2017_01505 [Lentisphaerae bacterium GWF2_44_16]|nr:MAG: hypothetical protein A2017_01505 [Lentisphaerae bacterium GWF2_44_16]
MKAPPKCFRRITSDNMNFIKKHPILSMSLLLPLVFLACLSCGAVFINPFSGISDPSMKLILQLRIYRLISAFTVGGALAVSGVGYQAVLRNPLAEPFILGISGGASLGAASAIASGVAALSCLTLPLSSFGGAIIVLCIVLFMAKGAGIEYTNNVMLSGVIAGTVCSSLLMFIISTSGSHELNSITWWMLGSLQPRDPQLLSAVAVITLAGTLILFIYGRDTNLISMGEEMAYYLGAAPLRLIILILGIASLMAASAVALSGIIGFVGLIVPHTLRRLFGPDHRRLFPLSLLCGGMFLMICDTIAKSIFIPQEIPVGIITSFIGGPFFLYILNKRRKSVL